MYIYDIQYTLYFVHTYELCALYMCIVYCMFVIHLCLHACILYIDEHVSYMSV